MLIKKKSTPEEVEKSYLNIGTFECWKCKKDMKIAWITTHGTFYGPEHFDYDQINKARNFDAKIDQISSKTLGRENYMANICPHCGSFVGQFFIHEYLYSEEYKEEIYISGETLSE